MGCDVLQHYNRLRAESFFIPLLGLPSVKSSLLRRDLQRHYVVHCFLCRPMGASFAVALAQAVKQAMTTRKGLGAPDYFGTHSARNSLEREREIHISTK